MTGIMRSGDAPRGRGVRRDEYHSITQSSAEVTVNVDDEIELVGMHLTARTVTEATIWGTHGTWRLQLRTWYRQEGDGVLAARTVASIW